MTNYFNIITAARKMLHLLLIGVSSRHTLAHKKPADMKLISGAAPTMTVTRKRNHIDNGVMIKACVHSPDGFMGNNVPYGSARRSYIQRYEQQCTAIDMARNQKRSGVAGDGMTKY
jgi:hypothetical protein